MLPAERWGAVNGNKAITNFSNLCLGIFVMRDREDLLIFTPKTILSGLGTAVPMQSLTVSKHWLQSFLIMPKLRSSITLSGYGVFSA